MNHASPNEPSPGDSSPIDLSSDDLARNDRSASPRAWRYFTVPILLVVVFALRSRGSDSSKIPAERREAFDGSGEIRALDGATIDLDAYRGRVLVLNFFATWCGPCVSEMPSMGRLLEKLGSEGLSVLAISAEPAPALAPFAKRDRSGVPLARDLRHELFSRYRVSAIPRTLVLDRQGRIAMDVTGAMEWDSPEMLESLSALLSES